jgi:uncharacterized protein
MEDEEFEWDDAKARQNLASHGVSLETARLAFDDPFAVAREDRRHDYGEDRYLLLGMVEHHLLAVAYAQWRAVEDHLRQTGRISGTTTIS